MSGYPGLQYGALPPARVPSSAYPYQPQASTSSALRNSATRSDEIRELRRRIPDCRPKNQSETVWELPVTTHDKMSVHVRIAIPSSYPEEPPSVSVLEYQKLRHVWVDEQTGTMTLHCTANWATTRSTLIEVIESAYEALSGRSYTPPPLPPTPSSTYPAAYMPSASGYPAPGAGAPSGAPRWPSVGAVRPQSAGGPGAASGGPASGAGGSSRDLRAKLEGMSAAELETLVCSDAAFAAFLQPFLLASDAGTRAAAAKRDVVIAAKQNMGLLHEYNNTLQQIQVTRAAELQPAENHYNELMARQMIAVSKLDLSSMLNQMQAVCNDANSESSRLEKEFLSGSFTEAKTAAFMSSYLDERVRYHQMKIKLDAARHVL